MPTVLALFINLWKFRVWLEEKKKVSVVRFFSKLISIACLTDFSIACPTGFPSIIFAKTCEKRLCILSAKCLATREPSKKELEE